MGFPTKEDVGGTLAVDLLDSPPSESSLHPAAKLVHQLLAGVSFRQCRAKVFV